MEAYHVVECIAPASLQTDHFLPAVPIRVAVDFKGNDLTSEAKLIRAIFRPGKHRKFLGQPQVNQELIPGMLKQLGGLVKARRKTVVTRRSRR